MKKGLKQIIFLCTILSGIVLFSTYTAVSFAQEVQQDGIVNTPSSETTPSKTTPSETTPPAGTGTASGDNSALRYPLNKTEAVTYEDLQYRSPADLQDPSNINSSIEYDPYTGLYIFRTKVGDMDIATPFVLNESEYRDYSMQQSMNSYWSEKNKSNADGNDQFSLSNIHVGLGATADKIFGAGGVQLKTQGSVDLTFGFKISKRENPTIPERNRKNTIFDFDTKIQLSANAKVGERVSFTMNYNTEATFDFDQKLIKLSYEGKEDDIIKRIEAGNVSLPLSSSLITGSTALFGIRTDLQFGKLKVSAIASQQESERKTITTQGAQTTEFRISAADYDENRHYFLSTDFYENYDGWAKTLPEPGSGIVIGNIEVWITNTSSYEKQSRNIIAFTDLGASKTNTVDPLYRELLNVPALRNFESSKSTLDNFPYRKMEDGTDYEKLKDARLLHPSEYTVNRQLGYISLRTALDPKEVLAVAYEYEKVGEQGIYKVGELTTDPRDSINILYVKLLKGTEASPSNKRLWNLYMKNVYSLGSYNIQEEKFRLDVMYYFQNDTVAAYLPYIPSVNKTILLRVLNLDRLNKRRQAAPDGYFDFLEGYTVYASNGRIVFPSTRPFDTGLKNGYQRDSLKAAKFTYPELYDTTLTVAKQFAEKNKFILTGEYRSSSGSEIRLGATNVPRGSVRVTAGGRQLIENEGFTVDYNMGIVRIIDEVALESNSPVSVTLESQSFFSMQRKSLVGTNVEYAFSDKFSLGGTLLHLSEKPLTQKVGIGNEPMANTIWGLNGSYKTDWQWLTSMVDKIPLIDATAPSSFAFSGEVAQLIPGHPSVINQDEQGVAYIDDFEGTRSSINIMHPTSWALASVPKISSGTKQFIRENDNFWGKSRETGGGGLSGEDLFNIGHGLNRAHLAWYYIDQIFTRPDRNTPSHLRNDNEQLSSHFVREVKEREIFQNREAMYDQTVTLQTLSLAYYPRERGPYNLDVDKMGADGYLQDPASRWGGIMRKIDNSDFEKSNVEYIEFWLMDPFVQPGINENVSGQLVFNLGDVSEDVLKDGRISFENGLPIDDQTAVDTTVWGRVPRIQAITNTFEMNSIAKQDVGLDGLSTEQEFKFDLSYGKYFNAINEKINDDTRRRYNSQIFSPLNDPAGDNFHHYRGSDYDQMQLSILDRYKYYNGLEGNSTPSSSDYPSTSGNYPNTEDLNNDRTLNEKEKYFEYTVHIDKSKFETAEWENNFIANKVEARVTLKNGNTETITWYQFKIPVKTQRKRSEGGISDFRSIRFIRMYLTGFEDKTHLRFGSMELVRTEWRVFERNEHLINDPKVVVSGTGKIDISAVNIENDGKKFPIPYVLPPGISRVTDTSQPQLRQENEQSMLIRIDSLESQDARAVYKLTNIDMRRYERFKMFVHAEKMIDRMPIPDNRLYIFIRLGSDFTQNYYEYQIPLTITPESARDTKDPYEIWPSQNSFDFPFSILTDLKLERDRKKAAGQARFNERYSGMHGRNLVCIIGNPSIGEVTSMMIGIRNQDNVTHSAEIWVNEMRMAGFNEKGGWGALANLGIVFSDLGALNLGGRTETAGFGGIEQNVDERRLDNYYEYNLSTAVQLGKFFPEKARVNMPFTYTYSKQISKPDYDPLNTDLKLDQVLDNQVSDENGTRKHKQDSIRNLSYDQTTYKSLALSNVRVGITSKNPMPYDPANFSFSVGYSEIYNTSPEVEYDKRQTYKGAFNYVYSLNPKPIEPFRRMKQTEYNKLVRDFNFYYLPTQVAFGTSMNRYYNERQIRSYNMPFERDETFPFMTYDKDWTWDRTSDIKFNLTRSLRLSLSTYMNSLIPEIIRTDEEDGSDIFRNIPINKRYLEDIDKKDWYDKWVDTVKASIWRFGIPVNYRQQFTISYAVPINKLPYLDWVTANAQYSADYTWDKGAEFTLGDPLSTSGNFAASTRLYTIDGRMNFETLYNRSPYLKEVNRKYSGRNTNTTKKKEPDKPKTYDRKNISLKKNTPYKVNHRLNTNKLTVSIKDKDGNDYPVKYSTVDMNTINLQPKEDVSGLTVSITSIVKERKLSDDIMEITARGLMMVRNISVNYRYGDILELQGYLPGSGFMGQDNIYSAPGYDFTFGFFNTDDYWDKIRDYGWVDANSTTMLSPAIRTRKRDLQAKSLVEPMPGLKIDLNAGWMKNNIDENYRISGRERFSGTYSKTTIAIKTAFKKPKVDPKVDSQLFNEFLNNRQTIATRLTQQIGSRNSDLMNGRMLNPNSSDVMVPAFYAAYMGIDAKKVNMNIMPNILTILPNWKISYDGLSRLDFIKRYFKSVVLNHRYECTYDLPFASLSNWDRLNEGDYYGYVPGMDGMVDMVSSRYYIGSSASYGSNYGSGSSSSSSSYGSGYGSSGSSGGIVSINERFMPLIGIETSFKNSLMLKTEYRKSRNMQLGIQGDQVIESYSNERLIGAGYRIDDFGMMIRLNDNKQKKVKNDLNIRADVSWKTTDAFICKISEEFAQLSSGLNSFIIKLSAEYVFNESLNIRLFYDRTRTEPKVSQGYPTTNINFGVGFRFLLVR